ncbi:MAG: DUF4212 domain-containing protein [Desulfobacteraceae bacterium]|nr:DUF4212 domain-containing protein [Desulfobacteraceae bacterium]
MANGNQYDINFFKPHTPFLKEATRLATIGLIIWGVATYGFQILLKVIETPTPEKGYIVYEKVYPKLGNGSASIEEKIDIANVYLNLIGKSIPLRKNAALMGAFTATVNEILPSGSQGYFNAVASKAMTDKTVDVKFIASALGIEGNVALSNVIPYALTDKKALTDASIPGLMEKYLIHNQSVLTDTIFLGFPFHYFYSALFLLTLFVVICLVYCFKIDTIMRKYGLESAN